RTLRRNRFRLQTHAGIRNRLDGGAQAGEHVLDEFSYRANGVTERQLVGATEEQAAVDVARERIGQAGIDTKLALLGNAVAQATLSLAVERHGAGFDLGNALQLFLVLEVVVEPGRAHGPCGQTRHTHEGDDVFGLGFGKHPFEIDVGVALFADRKGGAHLHRAGAQRNEFLELFVTMNATSSNERDVLVFDAQLLEELLRAFEHGGEGIRWVIDTVGRGRAQVTTRETRILDDDGVGQAILAHPFFEDDGNAAYVGQNGNDGSLGVVAGELGQVQRQTGAHHNGVGPGFARLAYVAGVFLDGLHDIDRNGAVAPRKLTRRFDFPVECNEVDFVDKPFVA